jgi:hypothetical protein
MAIAIYNAQENTVKTFIRDDYPQGYTPPAGYTLVPPEELPQGWELEPDTSQQEFLEQLRQQAKNMLDEQNAANSAVLRALVLVLINEINNLRQWTVAFKQQTALATNLANFQNRVSQLPTLNDRTGTQARDAIKGKLDAGDADQ